MSGDGINNVGVLGKAMKKIYLCKELGRGGCF